MQITSSTEYAHLLHRKIARSLAEAPEGRPDLGLDPLATRRAQGAAEPFAERRAERDQVSISEKAREAYEASKNSSDETEAPASGVKTNSAADDLENAEYVSLALNQESKTGAQGGAASAVESPNDRLEELKKLLQEAEKRLAEAQRKLNDATSDAQSSGDPAASQAAVQAAQSQVSAAQAEVQQLSAQLMELEGQQSA